MTDPIPANLQGYVQVLGIEGTIALVERFGGARVYLARHPRADGPVAAVVGLEAAQRLGEAYGDTVKIPLAKRWLARHYRGLGWSVARIARHLRCSDTTVYGYLADGSQLDLFSEAG